MMHRDVALKIIRPDLLTSSEAVERFRREVRLAAKLAHPHIVAAYDAEEIEGVHVLVMEFVEGKTLDAIVQKRGHCQSRQHVRLPGRLLSASIMLTPDR